MNTSPKGGPKSTSSRRSKALCRSSSPIRTGYRSALKPLNAWIALIGVSARSYSIVSKIILGGTSMPLFSSSLDSLPIASIGMFTPCLYPGSLAVLPRPYGDGTTDQILNANGFQFFDHQQDEIPKSRNGRHAEYALCNARRFASA